MCVCLSVCVSELTRPHTHTETQTCQSAAALNPPGQLRETILPRWHRRNTQRNTASCHSCWCQLTNKAPCRLSSRWQGENNGQLSRDNVFYRREGEKKAQLRTRSRSCDWEVGASTCSASAPRPHRIELHSAHLKDNDP